MAGEQLNEDGKLNEGKWRTRLQQWRRLLWPVAVGALALWQLMTGTGVTQSDRFASKLALVALGWVLWHVGRSQLFYYFDMKAWSDTIWAGTDMQAKAVAFQGYCILVGLLAVAVIIGLTTGL